MLPAGTVILLELSMWISDLYFMFCRKQMGHDKRAYLDLSRLRQYQNDGVGEGCVYFLPEVLQEGARAMTDPDAGTFLDNALHITDSLLKRHGIVSCQ